MFSRQLIYAAPPVLFMTLSDRTTAFVKLGQFISAISDDEKAALAARTRSQNAWFDEANVHFALAAIAAMLRPEQLTQWLSNYTAAAGQAKNVGVVMAGNIPAVGFHDFLSTLLAGHTLHAKLSKDDAVLLSWLTEKLLELEPRFAGRVQLAERLNNVDAVIATGSDNTARYFEYYFRNTPHIIRQNRTSVAVLTGDEPTEELEKLGSDIFRYYGLGCRNISKLFVPEDYDFVPLLNALQPWEKVLNHHKYHHNYDYNKSIYLVNRVQHYDTGFLMLTESEQLVSPISVLFYGFYRDLPHLHEQLTAAESKLQAVVSAAGWYKGSVAMGAAQHPNVWDYADRADTLQFLGVLE